MTLATGEMQVYALHHNEQNHEQERHFCKRCGTTLFWYLSTLPDLIGIAGGCFEAASLGEPEMSTSHSQKMEWITLPDTWKIQA